MLAMLTDPRPSQKLLTENLLEMQILRPHPRLDVLNQKLWGRAQKSVLMSPPGDSKAH